MASATYDVENARSQLRKGTLELCTLLIVSKKPIYASEILQELMNAHLLVVEGTLYPLLNRLRQDGLLEYEWVESHAGPPRKYYSLTQKGQETLKALHVSWDELNRAITNLIHTYYE